MSDALLEYCVSNPHNRYWWFKLNRHLPTCFAVLNEQEREQIVEFFKMSDRSGLRPGDCNVPCISMLATLIIDNSVKRVLSLGHSVGYSAILMAMYARKKGVRQCIYSVDIDEPCTKFAQTCIDKFSLGDHISLVVGDSADPSQVEKARQYFAGDPIDLVFVDTSHEYTQTLKELQLWFPEVRPRGLVLLHDCSDKARSFDPSGRGVQSAVVEFCQGRSDRRLYLLNKDVGLETSKADMVYLDGCGLAMIQKSAGAESVPA